MAKNSIRDFSATAASNTDIQSVDIDENCAASGINNAIRELMADLADVNAGTVAMTSPSADSLSTDTISEKTSGSGVTIDSVLLKDGALGSIASAVAAHLSSINGGQIGGNRNLIINGAMQINQRGNSTGKTSGGYHACDRFNSLINGAGTWSLSQSTTAPTGFSSSFKLDCTTADSSLAASDYVILEQRIEGQNLQQLSFGTSSAKKLTLSFYVRSNKTGTYVAEIQHSGVAYNNNTYTINSANTWEKKTITVSGNTSAVIDNDNTEGMRVLFWLAAGSTYSGGTLTNDTWHSTEANRAAGQVNLADSTSNEWYITGVQLEVGSTATDFEHRSFGDELARCQRYYTVIADGSEAAPSTFGMGSMYNSINVYGSLKLPTEMRTGPTLDATTGTNYYLFYRNNTSDAFNSVTLSISQKAAIEFFNQTEISGTAGHSGFFRTGNVSAKIALTAEL